MIMIKCDIEGKVTELYSEGNYLYLYNILEKITKELESEGIFMINEVISDQPMGGVSREFATKENGWEFVYAIAGGWVSGMTTINPDDLND